MVYPRINNTVLNCFKKQQQTFIYIKAKDKRRRKTEEEE